LMLCELFILASSCTTTSEVRRHDKLEQTILADSDYRYDPDSDVVYRNGVRRIDIQVTSIKSLLVFPEPHHPVTICFKALHSTFNI